ncbi:MAG: hypothetical protein ABW185_25455 [Sedimenticola sp.]
MSVSDQKALDDIEETLKQIQLEKTNLLEHLYREEKHYTETIESYKDILIKITNEKDSIIKELNLENAKLKSALTSSVYKQE